MGKAQRIRNKQRQNMTGVQTIASMEAEVEANAPLVDEGPRVPLLVKIDDPVAAHRVAAFQALSNLVIDDPETKQVLYKKENLRKILAHVCDPELEVRVASVGTLRNMTQFGEQSLSSDLIKNDIFTPVVAVIQQALQTPNANSNLVNQLLCQSVGLLMNLCENCDKALELFSSSKLLPFFAQFLHPKNYPYELVVTSGQFFFVLTDANPPAQQELLSIPGYSTISTSLIQDSSVPLRIRTVLAGIDANINATTAPHVWQLILANLDRDYSVESQRLFETLSTMEGEVVVRAIHSSDAIVVDEMPTPKEKEERNKLRQQKKAEAAAAPDTEAMTDDTEEQTEASKAEESRIAAETEKLQRELEAFQENIKSQKLALEILTNLCTGDLDDQAETMDDDVVEDDDNDEGEYDPSTGSQSTEADQLSSQSLIWSSGLFPRVLQLAYPIPPLNTQNNRALEGSEWAYNTEKYLQEVQSRAVTCLGNMLLDGGAKVNVRDPSKTWDCLVAVCAQSAQNMPLLEAALNAMWTLLRLFSTKTATPLVPTAETVSGIIQLARSEQNPGLRATAIGMLGIIAQLPQFKISLLDFGKLFLETLSSQNALCVAEALNSIFDVFAETTNNGVVRSLDMLKILRAYLPHLKLKVRNERKQLSRDVWDRLDEAKMNLVRFLKYKKNQ